MYFLTKNKLPPTTTFSELLEMVDELIDVSVLKQLKSVRVHLAPGSTTVKTVYANNTFQNK